MFSYKSVLKLRIKMMIILTMRLLLDILLLDSRDNFSFRVI